MSRFFSSKYLKYKKAAAGGTIEKDLPCPSCGYNLRGLNYGHNCPECGQSILLTQQSRDLMLWGDQRQHSQWKTGLGLASLCLAGALVARVASFVGSSLFSVEEVYVIFASVNWLLWGIAVWLITPKMIDDAWPMLRPIRLAARWLALLWAPGYLCLLAWVMAKPGQTWAGNIHAVGWLLRIGGGLGTLLLIYILRHLAEEAELDRTARRLNASLLFLPVAALILIVVPVQIDWGALIMLIPVTILFLIVLGSWAWAMLIFLLSVHAMYQHLRWADIHVIEAISRPERVQATRTEIDEEVEATIRPAPKANGDLPLEDYQ